MTAHGWSAVTSARPSRNCCQNYLCVPGPLKSCPHPDILESLSRTFHGNVNNSYLTVSDPADTLLPQNPNPLMRTFVGFSLASLQCHVHDSVQCWGFDCGYRHNQLRLLCPTGSALAYYSLLCCCRTLGQDRSYLGSQFVPSTWGTCQIVDLPVHPASGHPCSVTRTPHTAVVVGVGRVDSSVPRWCHSPDSALRSQYVSEWHCQWLRWTHGGSSHWMVISHWSPGGPPHLPAVFQPFRLSSVPSQKPCGQCPPHLCVGPQRSGPVAAPSRRHDAQHPPPEVQHFPRHPLPAGRFALHTLSHSGRWPVSSHPWFERFSGNHVPCHHISARPAPTADPTVPAILSSMPCSILRKFSMTGSDWGLSLLSFPLPSALLAFSSSEVTMTQSGDAKSNQCTTKVCAWKLLHVM